MKQLKKRITEMIEFAKNHTENEFVEKYNGRDLIECQHAFYEATGRYIEQ